MAVAQMRNSCTTSVSRQNAALRNMKVLLKGIRDQMELAEEGGKTVTMATVARHHRLSRLTEILQDITDILKTLRRVLNMSGRNSDSVDLGNIANMAAEVAQDSTRLLEATDNLPNPSETEGPAIEHSILDIHLVIENILQQLRVVTEEGRRCADNQLRETFGNPRLHPRTVDALQRKLPERYIRDIPVSIREPTTDGNSRY